MTGAEQITTFCSALLGGPDGAGDDRLDGFQCYTWTLDTTTPQPLKRTRWGRANSPAAIASGIAELASQQPDRIAHIFFGTGLLTEHDARQKGSSRRATNADVAGIVGLSVDIDIAGDGHADLPYPPDEAAARTVYEAVPLEPTMVVHSGHGLHAWWLLAEPWLITDAPDPGAEREAMYDLSLGWSQTLRQHARRLGGWKIDSTFDLARVMRVPGTWNCKPGLEPVPARILDYRPNRRYEIDDFREHLLEPDQREAALGGNGASLPGVDLRAAWIRASSPQYRADDYLPPWLAALLEAMPGSALEAVWLGDKTLQGDASPSGVDASLARLLFNTGRVNAERVAEAIMCRRLRTGEKVEKVDPTRRTDYLVTTVARIQASAAATIDAQRLRTEHWQRGAAGRVATALPDVAEPELVPDASPPADEFTDFVLKELKAPPPVDAATNGSPQPAPQPVPNPPVDAPPITLLPPPPAPAPPQTWRERPADAVECFATLATLLLPEPYRETGIEIWSLEYRDLGEQQKGRMVLRVPPDYDWPGGNRPATYRSGRPFYCAWYGRDKFEVPRGFRMSLTRDALIPALPVGANREAWAALIDLMVPYWQRDSSRSDLISQVHDWLLEFLVGHAATTQQMLAVDHQRSMLTDHAEWGARGAPTLYLCAPPFLDYVARQPGGVVGRLGKAVLGYLDLTPRRPRWTGSDGRQHRASWFEVAAEEFTREEWHEILTAARDALEAGEARRLRMVPGGSA